MKVYVALDYQLNYHANLVGVRSTREAAMTLLVDHIARVYNLERGCLKVNPNDQGMLMYTGAYSDVSVFASRETTYSYMIGVVSEQEMEVEDRGEMGLPFHEAGSIAQSCARAAVERENLDRENILSYLTSEHFDEDYFFDMFIGPAVDWIEDQARAVRILTID